MEWGFIARILEAWSLCEELKLLIMNWLNLVIFEILINGNISGSMEPRRGIRQGDPLNIFFSILCAKIFFSSLFNREMVNHKLVGVKILKKA